MPNSLFDKATKTPRRLKMYIFGKTGTGKTVTALAMPNPAVIDTEHGTEHYGKLFEFDVSHKLTYRDISETVDALLADTMGYKTLVIDPFSNVYDSMQEDLLRYLRKKKGDSAYQLTGLDYRPLKGQMKSLISRLNDLDMNVVITARAKGVFSNEPGDFMKLIGTAPEGPPIMEHMMDVVMEITADTDSGKRTAHVVKDRTNTLPKVFDFSYQALTGYFGIKDLEREPVKFDAALKNRSGRSTPVTLKGKEVYTAGVTAEQLLEVEALVVAGDQDAILSKLENDYGVASFLDLRSDEAAMLLTDLKPIKS